MIIVRVSHLRRRTLAWADQSIPASRSAYPTSGSNRTGALPADDQIQRPAPPDVGPRPAEVLEDGVVGAAGFLEGVGQDGEAGWVEVAAGENALVVGRLGEGDD